MNQSVCRPGEPDLAGTHDEFKQKTKSKFDFTHTWNLPWIQPRTVQATVSRQLSHWPCDVLPFMCVADILQDRFRLPGAPAAARLRAWAISHRFMAHCPTVVKHWKNNNKKKYIRVRLVVYRFMSDAEDSESCINPEGNSVFVTGLRSTNTILYIV